MNIQSTKDVDELLTFPGRIFYLPNLVGMDGALQPATTVNTNQAIPMDAMISISVRFSENNARIVIASNTLRSGVP